ncbi:MAG: ABC transporter ATP-binding protein [Firmicutes bacterium]|nr:ABC transporter ATP-binding protein [Bacillota bacterium]
MSGSFLLNLEGVTKTYRGSARPAVDSLDLGVRSGEIFGFLGPNGAGKTTTIKIVVGLLRPDKGRVILDGFDAARDPIRVKRQIGYVPDNPDLYDRLTGIEYLNFIADVFGVSQDERRRRIQDLADMFELSGAITDIIQSYSHGMKQKLALMGALLHDPRLFILDEPMVGLDPRSSHLFKELMRKHCDRGNAVFFSTHILEVAERLCDRVGIINRGRLIASGTMEELRAMHKTDESLEDIFLELTETRSLETASLDTTMETGSPNLKAGIKTGKAGTRLPGAGKGDRGR